MAHSGVHWLDVPARAGTVQGRAVERLTRLAGRYPASPGFCVPLHLPDALAGEDLGRYREILGRGYAQLTDGGEHGLDVRVHYIGTDPRKTPWEHLPRTYLNVRGEEALATTVRELVGRAPAVYAGRGLATEHVLVTVQLATVAHMSAVAVQEGPNAVEVRACWGLGEGLLEDLVPADRFRLTGQVRPKVTERCIAGKATRHVAGPCGTVPVSVPVEQRDAPCLSDGELAAAAVLCRAVSMELGISVQVEIACSPDGLCLRGMGGRI